MKTKSVKMACPAISNILNSTTSTARSERSDKFFIPNHEFRTSSERSSSQQTNEKRRMLVVRCSGTPVPHRTTNIRRIHSRTLGCETYAKFRSGFFLPFILSFAATILIISSALMSLVFHNYFIIKKQSQSISALGIAEAGVNYYLWHLAHAATDFCDGQTCTGNGPYGPYQHQYRNTANEVVGSFTLTITPPNITGGAIKIRSSGQTTSGEQRSVMAELGVPSFTRYLFLTNEESWITFNQETHGLVHSNVGIHFDGTADGLVTASNRTYRPSTCSGGSGPQTGVWGVGGPTSFWSYPVPRVDFNQVTNNLNALQATSNNGGINLPTLKDSNGKKQYAGYALQLLGDGTVKVGKVTAKTDNGGYVTSCFRHGSYASLIQTINWDNTPRALPANGIIFVEDNLWIWGTVDRRLTVTSARLPENASTNTNIFLQNDINYTAKDGSVVLGLISQGDLVVNSNSEDNLNLDAYLVSQKGRVFQPHYNGNIKTQLTTYGGLASYNAWAWNYWVRPDGSIQSGYRYVDQFYDPYLANNPPPLFPSSGTYQILSWREEPTL